MNLLLRVATAAVLLPLVLWIIWLGQWPLFGLIFVATAIILYEYFQMWAKGDKLMVVTGVALGLIPTLVAMLKPAYFGEALVAVILLTVMGFTLNPGPFESTWKRMATTVLGLVYGGVTLTFLYRLSVDHPGAQGAGWIFLALIVTWANDTSAYFAGRAFGKHKLSPLSPKKTWEGAFGGWLGSVFGALLAHYTFAGHVPLIEILIIGAIAGVVGPLGDLAESLMKRSFDTKDSGSILPGHGGLLDRVDALLITGPFVYLMSLFVHPLFS